MAAAATAMMMMIAAATAAQSSLRYEYFLTEAISKCSLTIAIIGVY